MGHGRVNRSLAGRDKKKHSTGARRSSKSFCFCMRCLASSCAARCRGSLCWGPRPSCCSSFNSEDGDFSYFDSKQLVILELENRRRARLSDCSAATAKAMESLCWVFSPDSGKLHVTVPSKEALPGAWELPDDDYGDKGKEGKREEETEKTDEEDVWEEAEAEEFYSVRSCFSRCSSGRSGRSGGGDTDLLMAERERERPGFNARTGSRQSVLEEIGRHCDGWPFGLRRKVAPAVLPPLPRSPSDSWIWRSHRGKGAAVLYKQ